MADNEENAPAARDGAAGTKAEARAAHWCSMLLDFSRRNRLLNFRDGPAAVELDVPMADVLEDGLSSAKGYRIETEVPAKRADGGDAAAASASDLEKGILRPKPGSANAAKRLQALVRAARNDLEEGGARTLFLSLGALYWKDGAGEKAPVYRAPLVLVPIELKRLPGSTRFELHRADAETEGNVTLQEMLRRERRVEVRGVSPLPEDERGTDVAAALAAWREAVSALDGWRVEPEVWIGRFSFTKFLLWKDLSEHLSELSRSPVVAHLLSGGGAFDDGVSPVRPADLGKVPDAELPLCPLPADSSQLSAVVAAVRGKNFVLFGPPGTGKSQTIANLIAASAAAGKSVLFVAEKRAALEVVERRLRKIGLSPFCLELHSNKAGKTEVLRQLREALDYAGTKPPEEWDATLARLAAARAGLDAYVRALHRPHACGAAPYAAFSFVMANGPLAERVSGLGRFDGAPLAPGVFDRAETLASALAGAFRDVPREAFGPLAPIRAAAWSPSWQEGLLAAARPVGAAASALLEASAAAAPGAPWSESLARLDALDAAGAAPWFKRFFRRRAAWKALAAAAGGGAAGKAAARKLVAARDAWRPVAAAFAGAAGSEEAAIERAPEAARDAAAGAAASPGALRAWCRWRAAAAPCEDAGFGPLVEAVASGSVAPEDAAAAAKLRLCEKLARESLDADETLRSFFGNGQDSLVETFCALDAKVRELSRGMIQATLSLRMLQARSDPALAKERALLARETAKKTRQKPVRQLLESLPGLLPVLKPCLLMSPLSVAQYLPAGTKTFDIVVFDEASQLSTWDAVGVLARGRQAVVVGDPKQLPPTSFFQRTADAAAGGEEVSEEDCEDLESILDECKAAGVPEQELQWHYRSRHESLIAFSNERYYGGTLFTFPSAAAARKGLGVRLVRVADGVYDRSGTRTNRKEAEAVVAAAVERLLDPAFAEKTCGIVTFSMAQQSLVEDLLDAEQAKHPEIQRFFDPALPEPFFVKNLENVQGDERDAIFFSVGYAPDATGAFAMNFGPLNRPGGERRLNVAVTRAKEEIVVFASFDSTRIDLSRTSALGAAHLKEFLASAERAGVPGAPRGADGGEAAAGDRFAGEVAQFVRSLGYDVDFRVGRSSYRIDIAVRAPGGDGSYVLGIECDGAMYRDAATARDRDESRRGVLEGLGWHMVRCWCMEWWFDREKAQRKLADAIERAVRGEAPDKAPPAEPLPPPPAVPPPAPAAPSPAPAPSAAVPSVPSVPSVPFAPSPSGAALSAAIEEAANAADPFERVYEPAEIDDSYSRAQQNFKEKWAVQYLGPQILRIVNAEGPIAEDLLFQRVLEEWGWKIATEEKAAKIRKSVPDTIPVTTRQRRRVYWPVGADPASWEFYRVPGKDPRAVRALKHLPFEELAAAFGAAIRALGPSASPEALESDVLRRFGLAGARVPAELRPAMDAARKTAAKA